MDSRVLIDDSWDRRGGIKGKSDKGVASKIELIKDAIFSRPEEIAKLMTIRPNWDEYFMILAKIAATRSTCLSRPVGAVIVRDKQVLSTGYNGSMPGVAHCTEEGSCFRRRSGYANTGNYDNCRSNHAEANALAQAAKKGISIEGSSIYVTLHPCYVCTKLLAGCGIKKVYYEYEYKSDNTDRDVLWEEALKQVGIELKKVEISEQSVLKTLLNMVTNTSWRRELLKTGDPTGRIENFNMEEIFKR